MKRPTPTPTPTPMPIPTSHDSRESTRSFLFFDYSLLDLLILGKYGATAGYNSSAERSWEVEYLHGRFTAHVFIEDLESMTDNPGLAAQALVFEPQQFQYLYGVSYFDFYVGLGEQLLTRLNPAVRPAADQLEVERLGFNLGVGNRWQIGRTVSFAVDWFVWSQPVFILRKNTSFRNYATNAFDRRPIEKAINTISYFRASRF